MIEQLKKFIKKFQPQPVSDEIATISQDVDLFDGYIKRLENPDPVLRAKARGQGIKLYDEIYRDEHAGSVLDTRTLAVIGKEWSIVPAGGLKKAGRPAKETMEIKQAKFVEKVLTSCNFDQMRGELLKAILYGYHGAEIMWQYQNGDISIKCFYGKHPRRFSFTKEREPRLITPAHMVEGEPIPDRKFLIFSWGDSDNPYGKGLGQRLWFPVWFKKHGVKFWMIFLEKFGMPTAIGKHPRGDTEGRDKVLAAIDAIRTETGIAIPEDMAIAFLEAARSGTATYGEMCEYMDKGMSKGVLGQTATTEGTPGKLGNETERGEVRQDILEADADLLDQYLNGTLIRWIVDYNFPNVTEYPQLVTHAGKKPDLLNQSQIDKNNIESGMKIPIRYFYETYGYPEPEEGEEVVERSQAQVQPQVSGTQGVNDRLPEFAEKPKFSPEQQAIEGLISESIRQGKKIFDNLTKPVRDLIANAGSLEEIRDKLFSEYNHMDQQDLEELLINAMFTARLHGRATIADATGSTGNT